jgi:hypothetical protein
MVTIAWDVDDVLNNLMRDWYVNGWKKKHPECRVAFDDISENPPYSILRTTREKYLESLDSFRASAEYPRLAPVEPVVQWFAGHGNEYRHIAVTRVPVSFAPQSAEWVLRHFGTWIRTYHFVPSPRKTSSVPVYDENKRAFFQWIKNVNVLVDDNEDNIAGATSAGIKGVLYPRPWNSNKNMPVETVLAGLASME